MPARGLLTVLILIAATASPQVIQKWKTPDGSLYFGDKPPAGSTKIGEEGSAEVASPPPVKPSSESPAVTSQPEDDGFSAKFSNARTKIERALRAGAERLADIRDRTERVKRIEVHGDPTAFASQYDVTAVANFQAEKDQKLRDLKAEERETYADVEEAWKAFEGLNAAVREHYGRTPDWWRSRIECRECPSLREASNALR